MRITSKGQVTIPKEVREKLGLQPGDEVGFREEGQAMILEKAQEPKEENKGLALARHLQELGKKLNRSKFTSEELMELTRGSGRHEDSR
jgi:AbrB family looped-hinge helix DNA binding protein